MTAATILYCAGVGFSLPQCIATLAREPRPMDYYALVVCIASIVQLGNLT